MSSNLRNERVRKELMREISDILRKEIRGLAGVVSITDVEVSHDNSFAKVFYSVLVQKNKRKNLLIQLMQAFQKLDTRLADVFV